MPATISPRRYARTTRVSILLSCLVLLGLVALAGCGGGGGHSHPIQNNPSEINGTITGANGFPIIGATVHFGSKTVTSTQNGSFIISNVVVPSGQTSLVGNVTATATVKGVPYSGQNQVEVIVGDPITHDVQIVLSPTSTQGNIVGTVTDNHGNRVAGARVFANVGPFQQSGGTAEQLFLANPASFNTTTRADGGFTIPALPPDTPYTVIASLAGHINQTQSGITVGANSSTTVNLTIPISNTGTDVPTPTGFFATVFTAPLNPTRAAGTAGSSTGFLNVVRQIVLKQHNVLGHKSAAAQKITLHRSVTRDAPADSLIETDVFWDYAQVDNLFGYTILRATTLGNGTSGANFASIATLRDPLADRFADNDPFLTPDTSYFYSIARLDTVNFPLNGAEGTPVTPVAQVVPLNKLTLLTPTSGSVTSATPTFTWNAVNRATTYLVLVYDQFPTLQSDGTAGSDPNGVPALWSASFTGTSGTYAGPALVSGHTYYWAVLGQDTTQTASTISPLQTFVAP